jgi:hypothetical protein
MQVSRERIEQWYLNFQDQALQEDVAPPLVLPYLVLPYRLLGGLLIQGLGCLGTIL